MTHSTTCQTCGKPLPDDAPQGICPACLLQRTLAQDDAAPHLPPEREMQDLAAAFPQLVIEELIGQGGMGRVYRAQQPHLNRTVALKVLSAERAGDPEWLERFSREARALARLSHPHIVQVYDFGEQPMPYLLMEHVDGVNLRQAMQNGGITAREALAIVPKLCDALHYAHEHGVLHRDIKPENILIDTEGRVKLVDFGLAKLRDEGVLPFTLTQSGAKLGTVAYMAPEQIEKPADVDHRADIYSLGVVLYEMLTGELPLGRFPTPSEASGVDARLDDVVMRTLEKKKEKRFQDAGEMRTGIENAQAGRAPNEDFMSREMFVTIFTMALWPVAAVVLSLQLRDPLAIAVVALSSSVLLVCGILRLRQQVKKDAVRSYYPARVAALAAAGLAFMSAPFWGPALMAGLMAALLLRVSWLETKARQEDANTRSLVAALFTLLGTFFSFAFILTLTAMVHDWLHDTLRTTLLASGIMAVDTAGLLLALRCVWPGLRRAWQQFHGTSPSPSRHAALELGICAAAAIFLAQSFAQWMPHIHFEGKPVWRAFVPPPAEITIEKKKTAPAAVSPKQESASARWKRRQEEEKPLAAKSNAWVARASQSKSTQDQQAVLLEIQEALRSTDALAIRPGLRAVRGLYQLDFDRRPFRDEARRHLGSESPEVRMAALYALMTCLPDESDQRRVLEVAQRCTEEELYAVAFAMKTVSKGDFTGLFAEPMLRVLEQGMAAAQRDRGDNLGFSGKGVLGAVWGSKVSPQIEARLIEWSHLGESEDGILPTGGLGYDTFYHALSVQANKSLAAVRRILKLAYHPDTTNIAGRCLWGLNGTVPEKRDQEHVAAEVITLLGMRNDEYLWERGLALIEAYAGPQHLEAMRAMAERETLPQARKEGLGKVIARLEAKP